MRLGEVRRRVPVAEQDLAGLAAQYPAEALRTVSGNVTQAQQLLSSAEDFVDTGEGTSGARRPRRRGGGGGLLRRRSARPTSSSPPWPAPAGAGRRVRAHRRRAGVDLLRRCRRGAPRCRRPADPDRADRSAEAIALGTAARAGGDPLAALRALGRAEKDLDNALARYRAAEERAERSRQLVEQRLAQVRAAREHRRADLQPARGGGLSSTRTHRQRLPPLRRGRLARSGRPRAGRCPARPGRGRGRAGLRGVDDDITSWGDPGGGRAGPRGST